MLLGYIPKEELEKGTGLPDWYKDGSDKEDYRVYHWPWTYAGRGSFEITDPDGNVIVDQIADDRTVPSGGLFIDARKEVLSRA